MRHDRGLLPGLKQRHPIFKFGVRHGQFVAQSGIDCESRAELVRILHVRVRLVAANIAREIADTLQKDDRLPSEETGESVSNRERREYEKAVGCDPLQHVDLLILVSAAKFQRVLPTHPTQRSRVVEDVFIGIARAGDWIPNEGIAIHLDEWRSSGNFETRLVLESKVRRRLMVLTLAVEELVAQK